MFKIETHDAWKAHVLATFPNEACGFVIDVEDGTEKFWPTVNTHETPDRMFQINGQDYISLYETVGVKIKALLHSHVPIDGKDPVTYPSKMDAALQIKMNMPFGISLCDGETAEEPFYFGEGAPRPPLIGRTFQPIVQDCLALLRDYYAEHNVIIPPQAYDFTWFKNGEDLYATNFTPLGFHQIPFDEFRVGDCCLMKLGAKVYNHAAVMCDPDLLLHHLEGHLSIREPLYNWAPHVDMWLRHEGFTP